MGGKDMKRTFFSDKEKKNYYRKLSDNQKLEAFAEMIADAENAVFLGGAGYQQKAVSLISGVRTASITGKKEGFPNTVRNIF